MINECKKCSIARKLLLNGTFAMLKEDKTIGQFVSFQKKALIFAIDFDKRLTEMSCFTVKTVNK